MVEKLVNDFFMCPKTNIIVFAGNDSTLYKCVLKDVSFPLHEISRGGK